MAAVAGVTELRNAVQAGIGTMNAFGKTVDDLTHIYDVHFMTVKMGILTYEQLNEVLGRVSASAALAGQGMETAFAALVAISRGGFGGVAFAEGSTRVVRFFQELSDPSAQKDIQKLGITVYDSFGRMRNAIEIVADLQAKLATMTEETRQATISQIFTNIRSAQGFQVLSEQLDVWREAQYKNIFAAEAMESAYSKQASTVAALMTKMTNKFTQAMSAIVEFLAPILDRLSYVFDTVGQNMMFIIALAGGLAAKYMLIYAATKQLAHAEKLRLVTVDLQAQKDTLHAAVLERKELVMRKGLIAAELTNAQMKFSNALQQRQTMEQKKATLAAEERVAIAYATSDTLYREIAAREGAINATERNIAIMEIESFKLQFRKIQMLANIGAMAGMTVGFYLMSKGAQEGDNSLRLIGGAITAVTMAIQIYTALLPIFLSVQAARTAAIGAETAGWWALFTAKAAATGGGWALAGAAGVAIAIGVITAATLSLGSATKQTTEEVEGLSDVYSEFEEQQEELEKGVSNLVDKLLEEGKSIGYITDEIERYINVRRGLEGLGAEALLGLAETRFAMVGGVGVVAPRFAETEEAKRAAISTLGLTAAEYQKGVEGYTDTIFKAQQILLDTVETEYDWIAVTRTAIKLFGEDLGGALATVWRDYGQQLQIITGEQSEFFEKGKQAALDYAESIKRDVMFATEQYFKEHPTYKLRKIYAVPGEPGSAGMQWLGEVIFGKYEERRYTEAQKTAEFERRLAESEYHEILEVANRWMTIGEVAETAITDMATVVRENMDAWLEGIGKVTKLDDMFQQLIEAGDQLDDAGIYFNGVAGQWDDLGRRWWLIQSQWEILEVMSTITDVFEALQGLPGGESLADVAARGIEQLSPIFEQTLLGIIPVVEEVFSGLPLDDPDFWSKAFRSDELVERMVGEVGMTLQEAMEELVSAVTGISQLDDFITKLVEAGTTLDDAGFYFGGVAGRWDELGENWARIQKMWMGLQMIQTILSVVSNLAEAAQTEYQIGETRTPIYGTELSQAAQFARQQLARYEEQFLEYIDTFTEAAANTSNAALKKQYESQVQYYQDYLNQWYALRNQTRQVLTGWEIEPVMAPVMPPSEAAEITAFQQELFTALLPILQEMTGSAAGSLIDVLRVLLADLTSPEFWDVFTGLEDAGEEMVKTIAEMAAEFSNVLSGASGFSNAIQEFVKQSQSLEDAGFFFKEVAGGWQMLGEEWARIQTYFKVSEMINSFIQAADAMREYGVSLPSEFENNMFMLMQTMATQVLPDFQGIIDELIGSIGNADFWDALADGMARAQITQSNSIVLAPYIVISERADADEVVQIVHDSLVAEAKRAGFTWAGG